LKLSQLFLIVPLFQSKLFTARYLNIFRSLLQNRT